ncbi:sigma-54-dependent Fis family transcriptional regulator [Alginatibacterium sediminis]|uniref:Sigma-54-dependent Fis family transcriptional regulator n=1 Tax=Alginatibacterium sediminis TaxID=2164068 RepID=A0A420EL89_9ALTE|nr:sigma-54 dependent transcriptional regulator [Alginatibacterium sediminis]RKF21465.1 sigma-54-dependent Fis family transcriptional regulator [Alginatibacterium sediminis]
MTKLLIIDDDLGICRTLQLHFESLSYEVQVAHCVEDGLALCSEFSANVIILDIRMEGTSGLDGIPLFKQLLPQARIIMITAFHDMDSTITAMQQGADEYIHKPIDIDELDSAVESAVEYSASTQEEAFLIPSSFGQSMVGSSHAMKEIYKTIGRIAATNASVMITGESGTGKEMVARAIHNSGKGKDAPFVAINCAALVETLLESEMFGHKKGAFTGAVQDQIGKFELANEGTLFLDEIGELSLVIQAKLLRVLQEKEFTPIGAKHSKKTNARIICASNIDFSEALKAKTFREDLYYRLQIVPIHLPPLRERREDIDALIPELLARANKELGSKITKVAVDAMEALRHHSWPGNVRELQNTLTKAVAICRGDILSLDLLEDIQMPEAVSLSALDLADLSTDQSLQEIAYQYAMRVLASVEGHKGKACDILKISRPRLQRLLERE